MFSTEFFADVEFYFVLFTFEQMYAVLLLTTNAVFGKQSGTSINNIKCQF